MALAGDGWRARIGIVIPSINTAIEPWYSRVVPEGVSVHTARMYLGPAVTPEAVLEMDRKDGMRAVREVASCLPDALAYICTASSVLQGPQYDPHIIGEIRKETGLPATTVTASILEALRRFGAGKVVVASPYTEDIDAAERDFFRKAGLEVLASHGMGIRGSVDLAAPEPGAIYRFARELWRPEAEALLITCGNLRSHFVIDALERDLNRPVVTSTQAPLWQVLRLAGIRDAIPGYGKLLTM